MALMLKTNVLLLFFNLFTGVLTARVLGPAQKGIYNSIMLLNGLIAPLALVGLVPALTYLYGRARDEGRKQMVWRTALRLGGIYSLLGVFIGAALIPMVLAHLGRMAVWLGIWTVLFIPVGVLDKIYTARLGVDRRFRTEATISVFHRVGFALLVALLALVGRLTLANLTAVALGVGLLTFLVKVLVVRKGYSKPAAKNPMFVDWPLTREVAYLGAGYWIPWVALMFNAQLDQLLVTAWMPAVQVGLYAVALSTLSMTGAFTNSFVKVFFPAVVSDDPASVIGRTETASRRGSLIQLGFALAIVIMARPALTILYGRSYLPALPAVLAVAPIIVFAGWISIVYQGCSALKFQSIAWWGEGVGAISGAIFLYVLVPRWGMVGAGIGSSLSYILDVVLVAWLWARRTGSPMRNFIPSRADVMAVISLTRKHTGKVFRAVKGKFAV